MMIKGIFLRFCAMFVVVAYLAAMLFLAVKPAQATDVTPTIYRQALPSTSTDLSDSCPGGVGDQNTFVHILLLFEYKIGCSDLGCASSEISKAGTANGGRGQRQSGCFEKVST